MNKVVIEKNLVRDGFQPPTFHLISAAQAPSRTPAFMMMNLNLNLNSNMKNKTPMKKLPCFLLAGLAALALTSGCSGTLGNAAVVAVSGQVVQGGKIIGGSLTIVSNTVGLGATYSAPGTNLSASVTVGK